MPSEYSKQSLGTLFGGRIASINYNFQTSSESSSATLTIVNENNSFTIPSFDQEISVPPFGLPMKILEHTEREDSKNKVLQVELIESSYEILDKELVLIYGEHTDLDYNLNNDSYFIAKGLFVPTTYYPSDAVFNQAINRPNLTSGVIKSYGNGINAIGTVRATYVRRYPVQLTGVLNRNLQQNEWITFNAGSLDETLSDYSGNFVYGGNESGDLQIRFGYTLRDLYSLIQSKGLRFDPASVKIMNDTSFFFQEAGTIREVLSACLAKIGRSFYVDPLSQKIVVISNKEIAEINTKLLSQFSNFQNTAAATQISLTKSIKDVESNHFVVKGDLDSFSGRRADPINSQRARKQKFYKIKDNFLSRGLNSNDIELMKIIAPILFTVDDEKTLDLLVYGLFRTSSNYSKGNLYNSSQCEFEEFEQKVSASSDNFPEWQSSFLSIQDDLDYKLHGFFNYKNAVGASRQYSDTEGRKDPLIPPSEVSYYQRVRDFMELWGGIYFSIGMSERVISERDYIEHAKFVGGELNTFEFFIAKGSDFISQVRPLQPIFNLLNWANSISDRDIKTDYTVEELANFATSKTIGDGDYYVIAKRSLFQGANLNSNDIQGSIRSNLLSFNDVSSNKSYLMVTNDAPSYVNTIARDAQKAFQREKRKVKDELVVRFTKVQDDSPSGISDEASDLGGGEETPSILFLRNIQSRIRNFSKRALTVIRNPISETKLFLENINEINPQFEGPFISTSINYFRPPQLSDFDMKNGVDSLSVSISEQGIQTNINYSSRKFAKIDEAFLNEYLGTESVSMRKRFKIPAFLKNKRRE